MKHEYTPEQALRKLIEKLTSADAALLAQVLAVVNAGKDVKEIERNGKKKSRFYRHTVPYSPEEALQVSLEVLRAHFIEQPLLMNSCHDNMAKAALGVEESRSSSLGSEKESVRVEATTAEKAVEIELQTGMEIIPAETALTDGQGTQPLGRVSAVVLKQQQENLDRLRELVDFTEN
jgi:hypothetical protein